MPPVPVVEPPVCEPPELVPPVAPPVVDPPALAPPVPAVELSLVADGSAGPQAAAEAKRASDKAKMGSREGERIGR